MTLVEQLAKATSKMAATLGDGMLSSDVGPKFTCTEADSVAYGLWALGYEREAGNFLLGHASGDSDPEDDRHTTVLTMDDALNHLRSM